MALASLALNRLNRLRDAGLLWLENFWQHNLRWILPLGVLLVSAAFGLLAPRASKSTVFLVAIAVIAIAPLAYGLLYFAVQRREWMPIIVLIACAFIPVSVPVRGSRYVLSLVLTTVFVALWLLRMLTVQRRFSLLPTPFNLPLLGFIATVLISLIWSNIFRDSVVAIWPSFPFVQVSASLVMIMLPALFLMVVNYVHDLKWIKILVIIMLIAAALGIVQQLVIQIVPVQIRGTFTMWSINLSMAFVLFYRGLRPWLRGLLLVLAIAWGYWSFGLAITWLASWLPSLVALVVLFLMRSRKLFALAICSVALLVVVNMETINAIIQAENEESGQSRLAAWAQNWLITRDHVIFGTGPAGYAVYYMTYFPTQAMATHSNYLDILSQLGVVGFVFYLWFFAAVAWAGYRLCQRLRGRGDWAETLANAALAGTCACIVANGFGDWLIPFVYTQGIAGYDYAAYNWLLLALIPVLERLTHANPTALTSHA